MQIHSFTAVSAVKITGILIYLALCIRTFPAFKMLLYKVKGLSVDNCFVSILEDKDIIVLILDTLFQLIRLRISLEVNGVANIKTIG